MKKYLQIGCVLFIGIASLVGLHYYMTWETYQQLLLEHQKIRDLGQPLFAVDMKRDFIPDDQNAAVALAKLAPQVEQAEEDYYAIWGYEYTSQEDSGKSLSKEKLHEGVKVSEKHQRLLGELVKTTSLSSCQSNADIFLDLSSPMDLVNQTRPSVRLLLHHVRTLEHQQQWDQVVQYSIVQFKLAEFLENEPVLVSLLVQLSCQAMAVDVANRGLQSGLVSEKEHIELEKLLALIEHTHDPDKWFLGERVLCLQFFKDLREGKMTLADAQLDGVTWFTTQRDLLKDEIVYIRFTQRIQDCLKLPFPQASAGLKKIDKELSEANHLILTKACLSSHQRIHQEITSGIAKLRCLRILNAMKRFNTTDFEELQLPPSTFVDPYSMQLMKLIHTKQGPIIYSVGPDLKDQQGAIHPNDSGDIQDIGLGPTAISTTPGSKLKPSNER